MMIKMPHLAILILAALLGLGWYFFGTTPRSGYREASVTVRGAVFRVDIADSIPKQSQGLSGRPSLADDEGMLFLFGSHAGRTFWMKDMHFPIDIVWIKGDRVVGFAENAAPEPEQSMFSLTLYRSPEPVDKVLEVPAGIVSRLEIIVGDTITVSGVY